MCKLNIIFVKWGDKYSHKHVNKLCDSLDHLNFPFYCYTDDPEGIDKDVRIIPIPKKPALKKWWNKLAMFSKDFPLSGPTLFFDLDVDVVDNLDKFVSYIDWGVLTVVGAWHKMDNEVFTRPQNYDVTMHSSVMTWNADNPYIHKIWDHFNTGQMDYYLRKYKGIDRFIVHEDFGHQYFHEEFIQSKKFEPDVTKRPIITYEELDYEV